MNKEKIDTIENKIGDFYWAYADILRGIGISPSAYDQRILAFMSLKLLIDNDKLLFNLDYKNQFGMNDVLYKRYADTNTQKTFINILNDIENLGTNLNYFRQESRYNPDTNENILFYLNHPKTFSFNSYIEELPNNYLEMVLQIYNIKADFSGYPKELYKDLYEVTISRMKNLSGDLTGQHFTQKSIIHLMCEMALKKIKKNDFIAIYDPACGTGSMIMESAYYFSENLDKNVKIEVYGQEYHGQTWLLAKIFLEICSIDGHRQGIPNIIAFGNTLTTPAFSEIVTKKNSFDFIIANPPFGVDWKHDYEMIISDMHKQNSNFYTIKEKDKIILPKKSDGQFLFMLQIIKLMLDEKNQGKRALAAIITSASLLTNGTKTSSEAKIRHQIFQKGFVQAVIEQPQSMFTNTDIITHIWFLDSDNKAPIRILKTDNSSEKLYSAHNSPREKMRNNYSNKDITKIIKYLNLNNEVPYITKDISNTDLFEINISKEVGKEDKETIQDLDIIEEKINSMLLNLIEKKI